MTPGGKMGRGSGWQGSTYALVAGGAVLIVGALLPWVTGAVEVIGIGGWAGWLAILAGTVAIATGWYLANRADAGTRWIAFGAGLVGALAALAGAVARAGSPAPADGTVGIGPWVTFVGGVAAMTGAYLWRPRPTDATSTVTPAASTEAPTPDAVGRADAPGSASTTSPSIPPLAPPAPAPQPITPGPYRGSAAPPPDDRAPVGYSIKADAESMRYHPPDSPDYDRTVAAAWFAREDDAKAAGFTRWNQGSDR
jgi:hypothetical protein